MVKLPQTSCVAKICKATGRLDSASCCLALVPDCKKLTLHCKPGAARITLGFRVKGLSQNLSSKRVYKLLLYRAYFRGDEGDTRSLDYSSYRGSIGIIQGCYPPEPSMSNT